MTAVIIEKHANKLWLLLILSFGLGAATQQFIWLLSLAGLALLIRDRAATASIELLQYWGLLALFLLPALVSLADSYDPNRTASAAARFVAYGLAAVVLFRWRLSATQLPSFMVFAGVIVMGFALDGLLQYALGYNLIGRPMYDDIRYGEKITGALGIDYGHVLAILSPFVFDMVRRVSARSRWVWCCLPLFFAAFSLSGSRASFAVLAASMALYALLLIREQDWFALRMLLLISGLCAGLGLGVLVLSGTGGRWWDVLKLFSSDSEQVSYALSLRPPIWAEAWRLFGLHWFNGVGLRAFGAAAAPVLSQVQDLPFEARGWQAHLIILEVAVDLGLLGLLGYFVFYRWVWRWCLNAPVTAMIPAMCVLLGYFPLASNLAAFSHRISGLVWLLLALALAMARAERLPPVGVTTKPPRRILIVRLSAIGDVVFSSPLIEALRRTWPEAHISWLVEPPAAPLLQHNSSLSAVIIWPKSHWQRLFKSWQWWTLLTEMRQFRRHLQAQQFDLVLDIQGLLKSAILASWTKAPRRIGLHSGEPTRWFLSDVLPKNPDNRRIGSEYLGFAQAIGLAVDDFQMHIALDEGAKAKREQIGADGPYVVICPFTTRPQKHWLAGHWSNLAAALHARGMRVVMLGGPADVAAAEAILVPAVDSAVTNGQGSGEVLASSASLAGNLSARPVSAIESLVGETRLLETAAVISGAQLLIGVDTGLTHMGIAFAVPTVALFGSTCPYTDTTRDNARVIYDALDCSPCRRSPTCGGRFECMSGITPARVLEEVSEVLSLC